MRGGSGADSSLSPRTGSFLCSLLLRRLRGGESEGYQYVSAMKPKEKMLNELVGEAAQIHSIFLLTHNWQSTWRGIEPAGIRHPFLEREQHRHGVGGRIDKAEAVDSCVPEGATAVDAVAGAKDGAGEIEEPSGVYATTLGRPPRPPPWGKEWT